MQTQAVFSHPQTRAPSSDASSMCCTVTATRCPSSFSTSADQCLREEALLKSAQRVSSVCARKRCPSAVSCPHGKRLGLEEVWSRVPEEYQARIQDHKWATITQQEHPYLGTPFFTLHPCHTASLMSQVPDATDTRYYLIKWLSSVGPVVGLHLPPTYATAFDATGKT
ncbi:ubiquitin-like-conjugating enzyme ATG10 isoform X5 [Littorina saxatilis]|uniref:ubiquitin-like-conjugating enzyme ATG10 isoform X5 n=1 Tax=Littorina saxatilis TaxID=31220 RepID=UPI0038B50CD1